jgi:oligopeptide/dipeptide ABC transporter ATP-binding protein
MRDGPHDAACSGPLLSADAVSVSRADGSRLLADVTLAVRAGETLAIVGESGSGKTMLLRALTDTLPAGLQRHGGVALPAGRWGLVFQDPYGTLDPLMPVGRQVAATLGARGGVAARRMIPQARDLLARAGLAPDPQIFDALPHQLSGGQRQRVGIALALVGAPGLLLADEPTTALDASTQGIVLDLFRRLVRSEGLALVLVTHDFAVVERLADRVAVLYAGRIVEAGPRTGVLAAPRHPYTRGLIAAHRALRARTRPLPAIPGAPPADPGRAPGCAFAPRCPLADARCRIDAPPTVVSGGASVACWHAAPIGDRE